jgi:hypothetical protein
MTVGFDMFIQIEKFIVVAAPSGRHEIHVVIILLVSYLEICVIRYVSGVILRVRSSGCHCIRTRIWKGRLDGEAQRYLPHLPTIQRDVRMWGVYMRHGDCIGDRANHRSP